MVSLGRFCVESVGFEVYMLILEFWFVVVMTRTDAGCPEGNRAAIGNPSRRDCAQLMDRAAIQDHRTAIWSEIVLSLFQ